MKLNSLSQEVFCALFWFFLFPSPFFCILLLLCLFLLAVSFVDSLAVEVMSLVPGNVTPCLESLREELLEKEQMMCGDFRDFQDLLDYLKSSGHSQCTTVWTKDSVAYRCRTCQVNDARSVRFAIILFIFVLLVVACRLFRVVLISSTSVPRCLWLLRRCSCWKLFSDYGNLELCWSQLCFPV